MRKKDSHRDRYKEEKKDSIFIYVQESNGYSSMFDTMLLDISDTPLFTTVYETELKRRWQQLLISEKGQMLTFGKLNWILEGEYHWEEVISKAAEKYDKVYVFFLNTSFKFHRPPFELLLKYKKRHSNIYYILFYIDLLSRKASKYSNYLRKKGIFDLVYSFDHQEAEKNGFIFMHTPYSVLPDLNHEEDPAYDMYSCMAIKERKEDIMAVLDASRQEGADLRIDLVIYEPDDSFEEYGESVSTSLMNYMSYREVLKKTLQSNCILEICLPGQRGMSLRAYEAVAYNKKLLTNNPDIHRFPFYDSRFMKYYNLVGDIDWDWVKKREDVDYGYKGEFSPKHLREDIQRRCERL